MTSSCSIVSLLRRILLLALLLFAVAAPVAASGVDNPEDALDYLKRADSYVQRSQYDLAINDYSKVIDLKPNFAEAYNKRGDLYFRLKQYNLAISDFNRAIDLNPASANFRFFRGIAYFMQNKYDLAIVDLNKAIDLNPQKPEYYSFLGGIHSTINQNQLAFFNYNKALSLDPNYGPALYFKALIFEQTGRKTEAIAAYQAFLKSTTPANQPSWVDNAKKSLTSLLNTTTQSASAAHSTSPNTNSNISSFTGLKCNGFYQETSYVGQGHYSYHYYRFFADGSVTACSSFTEERPADVYAALEKAPSGRGVCQNENGELKFTLTYPKGNVDYKAVIDGDKLHMKCHSYIINTDGAFDATFVAIN